VHAAGDGVLKVSASRIEKSVRPTDLVARLGGDEFAIVSEDISDLAPACALAERLATTLAEPFQVDGQTIQIGASGRVSS